MTKPDKIMDSLLVISFKSGDKEALNLLVNRWNKRLCAHAFSYVKDWSLAKDITQDTWRVILTKIHMLRDTNSFGSWALTITSRKALDAISRSKKRTKYIETSFSKDQLVEDKIDESREDKIQKIKMAMTTLPLEQKIVIKLFYLEEYNLKEISEITGASVNTVKTRLFRAREKIRNELKSRDDEKQRN